MKGSKIKLIRSENKGFTLIEIIVASIIGAFIAVIAVGALQAVSNSSEKTNDNIDRAAEIRFAAGKIAGDLTNIYRDTKFENMMFIGTIKPGRQGKFVSLKFYTVNRSKARPAQPEGDVYEVEYYKTETEQETQLMRRLQPNPDKVEDSEPGGILTAIASGIEIFEVKYFDGQQWQEQWDQDQKTLPELVEVTIGAMAFPEKQPVMESFYVSFVRSNGGQAETVDIGNNEEAETSEAIENSNELPNQ